MAKRKTQKPGKPKAKRPGKTRSSNKPSRKTPKRKSPLKGNGQSGTPWHRTRSRAKPILKKPSSPRVRAR